LQAEKSFLARACRARKHTWFYFAVATAKLYEGFDTLEKGAEDFRPF